MKLVTLDFETYYDADYTLKKMSTSAYITDPRFRCFGFAIKVDDKPAKWIPEAQVESFLAQAKPFLEQSMLLAHHNHFDGYILAYHYGIYPAAYLDTLCMARGVGLNATVGGSLLALANHFGIGQKPDLRPDSTPEEVEIRGTWDAEATYKLFRILSKNFPPKEYKLIDMTVREFTAPIIEVDVPMLTEMADKLDAAKEAALAALGVDATELGSPALFCSRLESLGVDVEWKKTPAGNTIPAIAKTDDFMAYLLEHEDETIQALAAARLGNKSTGDGTRARTFIRMAEHGAIPVYYNYYGAHPGRWSGGDGTNFANLKRGGVLRDAILSPDRFSFVVGDLAQIEARLTALLAGQEDLVEAFRDKRDVYCEFGTYAFRREITKADEFERFTSKFWVLGGGFGMGAAKGFLQTKAEINKRGLKFAPPSEADCQAMVDAYRAKYAKIPQLWKRMEWLIAEPGREIGPLTSEHEAILLPNGMRLRYPNLKWETYVDKWGKSETGYRYDSRKGRVSIWGGKFTQNCVGHGTEVLTNWGWMPIEEIKTCHRLWDGVEWVNHAGVVDKGVRATVKVSGVRMTPDHKILTTQGWIDGAQADGLKRAAFRFPNSFGPRETEDERQSGALAHSLRLRAGKSVSNQRCEVQPSLQQLRSDARRGDARHDQTSGLCGVVFDEGSVFVINTPSVAQLRRSWDSGVPAMAEFVRELLGRHGARLSAWIGIGPHRQQQGVFAGELQMGNAQSQCAQQTQQPNNRHPDGADDGGRSGGTKRHRRIDNPLPNSSQLSHPLVVRHRRVQQQVYDIVNCGPRNRFVVRSKSGAAMIVHNCIEALARIILADAMLVLTKKGFTIPLHLYDEITLCVMDESVENAKMEMQRAMTTPPEWMPDLPLAVEIGVGKRYGDAK